MIVIIIPAKGSRGINGHRMMSSKLKMPPMTMMTVPAISSKKREKKPTTREISLSKNMWNFKSKEAELEAVLAEICR